MLMPPSVSDWLPEDHFAWFVLDVVEELDLSAFMAVYRFDGRGGAAYHPRDDAGAAGVRVLQSGERSSRQIERRCVEDVAFRVIAANQNPDHATIARFRAAHDGAIAGLFGQVLALCARAGVLRPGLLAVDGTKLARERIPRREPDSRAAGGRDPGRGCCDRRGRGCAPAPTTVAGEVARPGLQAPWSKRRARLQQLLEELEAEAADKSYEAHMARRAEIEAATGRPHPGATPDTGLSDASVSPPGQHHRPGQSVVEDQRRLRAGLQRPSDRDRRPVRCRRRGHQSGKRRRRVHPDGRRGEGEPSPRRENGVGSAGSSPMPATGASTTSTWPASSRSSRQGEAGTSRDQRGRSATLQPAGPR